MPASCKFWVRT